MKSKAFFLVSLVLLVGSVVFAECPSVLIILNGSSWSELATTLLTQCLTEGGAQVTFAERAREVSQQYVVQFYEVLENTRSGKMRFHNELKASNLSETQLRQSYRGILESAERLRADRGEIAYGSKYMGSQQYSEFQRQTGYLVVDYGEEVEYSDWYDKLVTQQEQRAFWQTVYSWNADIIIFASLDIINLGQYGGIYTCRGVMSLRAVDVRLERPVVLKSFAVVANGVELSPEAAAQRIVDSLVKRCAKELDGVIPCYKYFDPPTPDIPLGAIGVAVVDVKAPGYQQEVGDSIRRMVEAAMLKHTEFAIYTRKELDLVLAEQRLGLSKLVEDPVEIGRLAGVRYLIVGRVTEFDFTDQSYYIDFPILEYLRIVIRNLRVGLYLCVIDAQTGQILWASEKSKNGVGFSVFGLEFNMNPMDHFRELVTQLTKEMSESLVLKRKD